MKVAVGLDSFRLRTRRRALDVKNKFRKNATGKKEKKKKSFLLMCSPPAPHHPVISAVAGAFDQHGRPLMVFPVDGQARLLSEVSGAEVVDFVNYFLYLHKYVDSGHVTPYVCVCVYCVVLPVLLRAW